MKFSATVRVPAKDRLVVNVPSHKPEFRFK